MIHAIVIDRDLPYETQFTGTRVFNGKEEARAWALESFSTRYEADSHQIGKHDIHFFWGRRKTPQISVYFEEIK